MGVTYDGRSAFPTGSFCCTEGVSVEERAAKFGLMKADPALGLPDLFYIERLSADELMRRNLRSEPTNGYSIEPIDGPIEGAWVSEDYFICTIPPNSPLR